MHITLRGDTLVITQVSRAELDTVRGLPSRRWDAAQTAWLAPYTQENWDYLNGVSALDVARPRASGYRLDRYAPDKDLLLVKTPPSPANIGKCRDIPEFRVWNATAGGWLCKCTPANVNYLRREFPEMRATKEARALIDQLAPRDTVTEPAPSFLQQAVGENTETSYAQVLAAPAESDWKFKTAPFAHQLEAFRRGRDRDGYAYFMEQGTGKTFVTINDLAWNHVRGEVSQALILCPNAMKEVWREELAAYLPDYVPADVCVYRAQANAEQRRKYELFREDDGKVNARLRVLIMNSEALSSERGQEAALTFAAIPKTMVIADESSRFKTPSAKRTKTLWKLGHLAVKRRILSGTPVTQGPLDAYAQFRFLDENILGFSSFYAFRNRYALLGGWNGKEIRGYTNLDELWTKIEPVHYRILRKDCLDLPPKVYQKLSVELSPEQRRLYNELKSSMITELDGREVSVSIVITQMLRLQQIVGGFVRLDPRLCDDCTASYLDGADLCPECEAKLKQPEVMPVPGPNPKLDALLEELEDQPADAKTIVWCRFRPEIDLIATRLRDVYGADAVVEFHGGVDEHERSRHRLRFQDPKSPVRFFVGQVNTGGIGITLTRASLVVYYSNDFSLEARLQSEDRAHRIGQDKTVVYVDLVAENSIDAKVITALRAKKSLAALITRDTWQDWI